MNRIGLLVCLLAALAAPARAQVDDRPVDKNRPLRKGDVVKKKKVGDKNVYVIDQDLVVEGRVARPAALVFLSRTSSPLSAPGALPGWLAAVPEMWRGELLARARIGDRLRAIAAAERRRATAGLRPDPAARRERERLQAIAAGRDRQERERDQVLLARVQQYLQAHAADPDGGYLLDLLGHLQLRVAAADHDQALAAYEQESAPADEPPAGPDHRAAIAAWSQVLARHPGYRERDWVLYNLAWAIAEGRWSGGAADLPEPEVAGYLYAALVCGNRFPLPAPDPLPEVAADAYDGCTSAAPAPLRAEAWLRLGDQHFDQRGELVQAVAAYEQAVAAGEIRFREVALYKLAWALYRLDRMEEALRRFDEVLAGGGPRTIDVRAEAVRYAAIVMTEAWDPRATSLPDPGEALARAEAFYRGREREAHVHDVWAELGAVLSDLVAYREAGQALQIAVGRWPLHRDNPAVHERLIDVLARSGDHAGAGRERTALVDRYGRGSAWDRAHARDRDALAARDRAVERALREAALQTHAGAQQGRQQVGARPGGGATDGHLRAAELYRRYLELYPASPESARMIFLRGEALLAGGRPVDAVAAYRQVLAWPDAPASLRDPAALGLVNAWSAAVGALSDQPAVPGAAELRARKKTPAPPAAVVELRRAIDAYLARAGDVPGAARLELEAARAALRWRDLPDAERRLVAFLDRRCTDGDAPAAKTMLLTLYDGLGRHADFEATVRRLAGKGCAGRGQSGAPADFEVAAKYGNVGNPERAGETYYQAYRRLAADHPRRGEALFHAGSAWEKGGMLHHAFAAYRELTETPALAGSPYLGLAVQRKAALLERIFDHRAAAAEYVRAARLAGEPDRRFPAGFDRTAARREALAKAAALLELERAYHDRGEEDPGAATLYEQAAGLEADPQRAMDLHFRAVMVYARAGDEKQMWKMNELWEKRWSERPEAHAYRVRFRFEVARLRERLGKLKTAIEDYRKAARYHQDNQVADATATALAAEAWLRVADDLYRRKLEPLKAGWSERATLQAAADEVRAALHQVIALKVDAHAVGAMVRLGDVELLVADRTAEWPVADIPVAERAARARAIGDARKRARQLWVSAAMASGGDADRWSREARSRLRDHFDVKKYRALRPALIETEPQP